MHLNKWNEHWTWLFIIVVMPTYNVSMISASMFAKFHIKTTNWTCDRFNDSSENFVLPRILKTK